MGIIHSLIMGWLTHSTTGSLWLAIVVGVLWFLFSDFWVMYRQK